MFPTDLFQPPIAKRWTIF